MTAVVETAGTGQRVLALENDSIRATVLVDNGADIYELVYKPAGTDVLFKPRWGLRDRHSLGASPVLESWIDSYSGGWQEILPNAGAPSSVGGATLPFFGEVAVSPWQFEVVTEDEDTTEVALSITLVRSPLKLVRTMRLERGTPALVLSERLVNDGSVPTEFVWGHHPAFGAPFIGEGVELASGAHRIDVAGEYEGVNNPLELGAQSEWPLAPGKTAPVDLSVIPGSSVKRDFVAYISEFDSGWVSITNRSLGFGLRMTWDAMLFPYATYWQELHSTEVFPWFGTAYVCAIEPMTSYPATGVAAIAADTGTQQALLPGEAIETTFGVSFFAVS